MRSKDRLAEIIVYNIIVKNTTDLHIGGGMVDEQSDNLDWGVLYFQKDAEGQPFIPGASIAGVLLRHSKINQSDINPSDLTFQRFWGDNTVDSQSHISIGPALLQSESTTTDIKTAVKINEQTGVGEKGALYQYERLLAGAEFKLTIEIKIREGFDRKKMIKLAGFVKTCFEEGIRVGAKANKNYGQLGVVGIDEAHFKAIDHKDEWLAYRKTCDLPKNLPVEECVKIDYQHSPKCELICTASLAGGIITAVKDHDVNTHIDSKQMSRMINGNEIMWLDAESILGPIRHRARRILNTIANNDSKKKAAAQNLFEHLFGYVRENKESKPGHVQAHKSRISVSSSMIKNVDEPNQSNIVIDRFTGGALDAKLRQFTYVYKEEDSTDHLRFKITIANPADQEVALLLHVLRDLACGDLAIGGKKNIGKGRISGLRCDLDDSSHEGALSMSINDKGEIKSEHGMAELSNRYNLTL